MKQISVDNGATFVDPAEALKLCEWDTIVSFMDNDAREATHRKVAPCSQIEFLNTYLDLAQNDLIIG